MVSAFSGMVWANSLPVAAAEGIPAPVSFNRDIRPILSDNCYACHGPDKNTRKAKLRLDQAADALAEHENGRPVVPGDPGRSSVLQRVLATNPDEVMPPPKTGKKLSAAQVELIRQWIAQGARYEGHWAYTPPARPALPVVPDAAHPIDAFVLARLRHEGIQPSPVADKRKLIRRLSLDLTGLPPDPKDVAAFVRSRDPQDYGHLVEKYLASDAHAERMTMQWLDWVRYADTIGFHGDCDFSVWPYRDYVLRAFRSNLPFDRFTREQLAGDLLPNATTDQKVASAYNRLLRISTEGGAQDKEYLAKYAADRVRTTAGVWLGATMGCAECHDHKFDPYSTRDFYSFAAFFADLKERGFYAEGFDKNDWGPKLTLPSPEQQRRLDELDQERKALRARIDSATNAALAASRQQWEAQVLALDRAKQLEWRTQSPLRAESKAGATLTIGDDKAVTAGGLNPDTDTYVVSFRPGPGHWESLRLETLTDEIFPGNRIARAGTSYVITGFRVTVAAGEGSRPRRIKLAHVVADTDGEGFPAIGMLDDDERTGWAITSGHSRGHQAAFHLGDALVTTSNSVVTVQIEQHSNQRRATIGRFKLALHALPAASIEAKGLPDAVLKAIQVDAPKRDDEQTKRIVDQHRRVAPSLAKWRRELARVEADRNRILARVPSSLVSEAVTKPRLMRVLPRGNWMDDSGAEVTPAVPSFLRSNQGDGRRLTRLDLADWITAKDNPLTARVFVKRMWKQLFRAGLPRTPDA